MWKVNENNVCKESVEEKSHSSCIGILSHHTPFDIANNYLIGLKHCNIILWINNNKLTLQTLMIKAGHLPQMLDQVGHLPQTLGWLHPGNQNHTGYN